MRRNSSNPLMPGRQSRWLCLKSCEAAAEMHAAETQSRSSVSQKIKRDFLQNKMTTGSQSWTLYTIYLTDTKNPSLQTGSASFSCKHMLVDQQFSCRETFRSLITASHCCSAFLGSVNTEHNIAFGFRPGSTRYEYIVPAVLSGM